MAGNALQRGSVEPATGMALDAWRGVVSSGEREGRLCVVEPASPGYGGHRMALRAICAETRRPVRWCCRRVVARAMTAKALRRHAHIFILLLVDMASFARSRHMRSEQGELRAIMALRHIGHQPGRRRMTP